MDITVECLAKNNRYSISKIILKPLPRGCFVRGSKEPSLRKQYEETTDIEVPENITYFICDSLSPAIAINPSTEGLQVWLQCWRGCMDFRREASTTAMGVALKEPFRKHVKPIWLLNVCFCFCNISKFIVVLQFDLLATSIVTSLRIHTYYQMSSSGAASNHSGVWSERKLRDCGY